MKRHLLSDELRPVGRTPGCCGMLIPQAWGGAGEGAGTDTVSYVMMLEEVARVDAALAVALSVTNSLAAVPIFEARIGPTAAKKYLSRLAQGKILGAFCLTEPQAGSDLGGNYDVCCASR